MNAFQRQLVTVLFPVLSIGAAVIFVSVGILRRELLESVEQQARSEIRLSRADIERFFERYQIQGRAMAATPIARTGDLDRILVYLRAEKERAGSDVDGLYWNDPDGSVTGQDGVTFSVADRGYFPRIAQGQEVVTGVVTSRGTGRRIVLLLFPVFDGTARVGAIGLAVSVDSLIERIAADKVAGHGEVVLLTSDGELLSPSVRAEQLQGYLVRMTPDRLSLEGPKWPDPLEIYMEDIQPTEWRLVHVYRRTDLLSAVRSTSTTLILTLVAGSVLVCMTLILVARRAIEPIRSLAFAMQRYGRGEHHSRAPIVGSEEIRSLATAFNTMAEMLDQRERERNQALSTLAQQTELHYGIIDNTLSVIFVKDLEGRYIKVNASFVGLFGLTLDQILGKTDRQIFDNAAVEQIIRHDQEIIRSGAAKSFEEEVGIGSEIRSYLTVKFPIRSEGSIIGVGGISTEITEHKRVQARLLQSQRMESIGRLAGGIAHDFNNLLTAILGYCDLACEQIRAGRSPVASLAAIKESGDRAATLTRQLLAFGRRSFGAPQTLRAETLLLESLPLLEGVLGDTIALKTRVTPDAGAISIDPTQFQQVLLNLASNARDAMPRGGVLSITIERASASADPMSLEEERAPSSDAGLSQAPLTPQTGPPAAAGDPSNRQAVAMPDDADEVRITIADTGNGISPEAIDHVFEPFFSTKSTGKGVGLGLASTDGIIRQAGGRITVQSSPGIGTTFIISLPRHPSPTAETSVAHREHTPPGIADAARSEVRVGRAETLDLPGGTETILYCESASQVRVATQSRLRELGYDVIGAASGPDALGEYLANRARISLILTEIAMPGMSGPELIDRLRAFGPLPAVLFIRDDADTRDADAPHPGSLRHPILRRGHTIDELAARIRHALDSSSAQSTNESD